MIVVQALLWLLLLRFVLRTVGAALSRTRAREAAPRARAEIRPPEDLVQDRVCHTYVPRSRAISTRVSGQQEWFCSTACRDLSRAAASRAS